VIQEQQKIQLLKAEEIAAMLGLKVQTVYAMARRGELEKVKLSRRCLRFRAGEVERFIERKAHRRQNFIIWVRSSPVEGRICACYASFKHL